jgi:hemerythrin-like domain-containing protein
MLPIGPLMEEHRLIEKMMHPMRQAVEAGRRDGRIDLRFVGLVLDFIRTYADRCHHGKEEDILFKALEPRPLTTGLRATMNELIEEHRTGRQKVHELSDAAEAYRRGDAKALRTILDRLAFLTEFYPAHIKKEDKCFFLPVMDYFDDLERADMLEVMMRFDRGLIHEVYRGRLEKAREMAEAR